MNTLKDNIEGDCEIILASPRGFCAGVDRAISMVENAIEAYGAPIYVKHQIVHNPHVVNELSKKGGIFVENISEIPRGSRVIFSAHGVSPKVKEEAELRKLKVLDATCPLVTKVHNEATKFYKKNFYIILIGHREHVEVAGTVGYAPGKITVISTTEEVEKLDFPKDAELAYITQTTLSIDDTAEIIHKLKEKFPKMIAPSKDDICYATQNRQNAVKELCKFVDLVLVVGAPNSSNTLRLVETAQKCGVNAIRIENKNNIKDEWLKNKSKIGISAGASAPEEIVQQVVKYVQDFCGGSVRELEIIKENLVFPVPSSLKRLTKSK